MPLVSLRLILSTGFLADSAASVGAAQRSGGAAGAVVSSLNSNNFFFERFQITFQNEQTELE